MVEKVMEIGELKAKVHELTITCKEDEVQFKLTRYRAFDDSVWHVGIEIVVFNKKQKVQMLVEDPENQWVMGEINDQRF